MPKPIPAKYSGICGRCGKPFLRGSMITYSTTEGASRKWYHSPECPTGDVTPDLTQYATQEQSASGMDILAGLADALAPHLEEKVGAKLDENQIASMVEKAVEKIAVPTRIEVRRPQGDLKFEGLAHKNFADLLELVEMREHVYLHGDAGWGKSEAAKRIAEILGLPFGYISLTVQTTDSRLVGYMDANGNYRETQLRKLFETAGVYLIDEADNASGNTLTALNSLLANGRGAFPDGMIERHPDFVCIATGNTVGNGGTAGFADRRPLDQAFRDRFVFLEWAEDKKFERTIALQHNPNIGSWVEWIQNVRAFCKREKVRLTVSPRATYKGAKLFLSPRWDVEKVANAVLFKGIDGDTVKRILAAHPYPARPAIPELKAEEVAA